MADTKGDPKKLYNVVHKLTGSVVENPPDHNDETELAEQFSDFFMPKINKIRDSLNDFPKYTPELLHVPKLSQYQALTEDEVKHTILFMTSKPCKQDAVPTKLLKDILPSVISIITNIVNISLTEVPYSY